MCLSAGCSVVNFARWLITFLTGKVKHLTLPYNLELCDLDLESHDLDMRSHIHRKLGKVSGLLGQKIVTFDPSLVTFRNLEHFKDLLYTEVNLLIG